MKLTLSLNYYILYQVVITEIGTLENTPQDQTRIILSGLGGRRRGLGRPSRTTSTTTTEAAPPLQEPLNYEDYYYYDEQ